MADSILESLSGDGALAAPRIKSGKDVRGVVNMSARPGTPEYAAQIVPPAPDPIAGSYDPDSDFVKKAELGQEIAVGPAAEVLGEAPKPRQMSDKRVAIYTAKNDLFSVQIESLPDWEGIDGYKPLRLTAQEIIEHIEPIVRALGVRFLDKTGGDLEETYEAGVEKPTPLRKAKSS